MITDLLRVPHVYQLPFGTGKMRLINRLAIFVKFSLILNKESKNVSYKRDTFSIL